VIGVEKKINKTATTRGDKDLRIKPRETKTTRY
jgi:hypothetical protein